MEGGSLGKPPETWEIDQVALGLEAGGGVAVGSLVAQRLWDKQTLPGPVGWRGLCIL